MTTTRLSFTIVKTECKCKQCGIKNIVYWHIVVTVVSCLYALIKNHECYCSQKKTLNSKKYGVDLIHYTHTATTVVHSSTKIDGMFKNFFVMSNCIDFIHAVVRMAEW